MLELALGGERYLLDPAAISAVRYRAEYGCSVVTDLSGCQTAKSVERVLLRMCRMMIPPAQRPSLEAFARAARRDGRFFAKAQRARSALLAVDPAQPPPAGAPDGEPFDEYGVLALMALTGVDMGLLYELPITHLVGILRRCGDIRDPDCKTYRLMTADEMARLYPK